ncbi:amino acid/amide ABC transporter membrane protein 1 (HAAT family) [Actinomadura hallensis]|uniref:Amino acid/amide ABC transporter membrane protein 1 (HAAT family) n=1 Tax=Actinomadura hallensis TaxID=337895 RepID=A0A543IGC3_9ACTN|nr:branched-chain amino acid ABC transporter permease [Actinomadura hallensis]TQM69635.1 amino acid/amide ABC transporter membrane protein 1 (HAAT family) [Actinomadura hallensis]
MVLPELLVGGVAAGAVYGLVALGLVVVHSSSNVVNFSQGSLSAIAAYVFAAASGLPLLPAMALAVLVAAAVAGLMQATFVSWSGRFGPMNALLVTIALLLVADSMIREIWGSRTPTFPRFLPDESFSAASVNISVLDLAVIGVVIVTAVLFWLVMQRTSVGLVIRGTADNPRAASLMGISPRKVSLMVWIVGGALAGIAGLLLGHLVTPRPEMGLAIVVKAFAGAVIGGFASPLGAIAGSVLLGVTEALTAYYIGSLFQDAVPLVLIVLFLAFRPQGLVGAAVHRAV